MASGCVRGSDFGAGVVLLVVVALISVGGKGVWGQTPSCASNLVPCATYLNGTTKPPDTCCSPLKEAITNQLECLCTLFNDPSIANSINVTQALDLPKRCGISSDLNACNKNEAPSPTSGGPTGTGTGTAGRDSGAPKLAWMGISGLTGLVLVWASILA